jgi:hypothetical protein
MCIAKYTLVATRPGRQAELLPSAWTAFQNQRFACLSYRTACHPTALPAARIGRLHSGLQFYAFILYRLPIRLHYLRSEIYSQLGQLVRLHRHLVCLLNKLVCLRLRSAVLP